MSQPEESFSQHQPKSLKQDATSSNSLPESTTDKKPFYKRPWFIILAAILILGLIGTAIDGDSDTKSTNTSQSDAQASQEPAATEEEFSDSDTPQAPEETTEPSPSVGENGLTNDEENLVMDLCVAFGEAYYPYGFDPHQVLGLIHSPERGEDGNITYAFTADLGNAYGGEIEDVQVYCTLSGQGDAIELQAFHAYKGGVDYGITE